MKKILALILFRSLCAFGAEQITMFITVTNPAVTGNEITVNGTTRIWTNSYSAATIQTNSLAGPAATATNLAIGNIVDVVYEGTVIGAWVIEDIEEDLVSAGENADRGYKVSGRGVMSLLDRAVVWPADINTYDSQIEYTSVNPATLLGDLWAE